MHSIPVKAPYLNLQLRGTWEKHHDAFQKVTTKSKAEYLADVVQQVLTGVPGAPLLAQLCSNAHGKAAENGQGLGPSPMWETEMEFLTSGPSSAQPALTVVAIWGVGQWTEGFFLCLSFFNPAFQLNKQINKVEHY